MIAILIKDHREVRKLSLRKLAKSIGVSHTVLERFEKGGEIDHKNWIQIAKWVFVGVK